MSDAPATAAPVKTTKKRAGGASKPKKPATHPKYSEMITAALSALKERGGSSRQAILKYVVSHYKLGQDDHIVNSHLKMALRAGVKNGSLKQSKGSGAAGSFRLGEKSEKKAAKKAAKPKSPKKAAKPKSPKKAAKPKSPKKAKAASSPKKAKAAKPMKAAASGEAKPPKAKTVKKVKSPAKPKATKPKTSKAAKPKAGGRKK